MTISLSTAIDGLLLLTVTAVGYGVGRAVVQWMREDARERVNGIAAWLHRKVGAAALPVVMALIYSAIASLAFVYPQSRKGMLLSILVIGLAQMPFTRSRRP